jgi:hypothetical protein
MAVRSKCIKAPNAQAGVFMQPFHPIRLSTLHLAQNRSHVRAIVIDGRMAWTGALVLMTTGSAMDIERVRATNTHALLRTSSAATPGGVRRRCCVEAAEVDWQHGREK